MPRIPLEKAPVRTARETARIAKATSVSINVKPLSARQCRARLMRKIGTSCQPFDGDDLAPAIKRQLDGSARRSPIRIETNATNSAPDHLTRCRRERHPQTRVERHGSCPIDAQTAGA